MHYVAVFNDVLLAFDANLSCIAASLLRAKGYIISILDDLGTNKALLEVGVDDTCRLRSLCALAVGPGTRLVSTCGEECLELEQAVSRLGDRICVTHKELLGTWEENAASFKPGQTVTGIVRSIETYGVFVELTPNLAGLAEYREDLHIGQRAAVYIKSMIPSRMKVKLALIDAYRGSGGNGQMRYRIPDTVGGRGVPYLERWQYSPDGAEKCVESVFAPL